MLLTAALIVPAEGATFTVTNEAGTGSGSLYQAILDANATPNTGGQPDRIHFNIPSLNPTINLTNLPAGSVSFPEVTEAVIIDGTTQPGYDFSSNIHTPAPAPKVLIDGAHVAGRVAFRLAASGCQVWGLGFDRIDFKSTSNAPPATLGAITCENGTGGHLIRWCYFGGTSSFWTEPENRTSVLLKSPGNRVEACLFFSHVDECIRCEGANGTGNKIEGNWFGLGIFQGQLLDGPDTTLPPVQIRLRSSGNTVGGTTASQRNIIATKLRAVQVESPNFDTENNVIEGNWIGIAPPTVNPGIRGPVLIGVSVLHEAFGTVIRNNIIGGCQGIAISLSPANGTQIISNILGTNADGTAQWENQYGIVVTGASQQATIQGNIIKNSVNVGIGVSEDIFSGGVPQRIWITQNQISKTVGQGISLGDYGVLANDPLDADGGPNLGQNFPIITGVTSDGIETTYSVQINSAPLARFEIEVFTTGGAEATGAGEGETYVGTMVLTTNSAGFASGNLIAFGDPGPCWVTATATASFVNPFGGAITRDGTSEFSAPFRYGPLPLPFEITAIRRTGGIISIDFPTQIGYLYTVQSSTSLGVGTWPTVETFTGTVDGLTTRSFPDAGGTKRFYRVVKASPLP